MLKDVITFTFEQNSNPCMIRTVFEPQPPLLLAPCSLLLACIDICMAFLCRILRVPVVPNNTSSLRLHYALLHTHFLTCAYIWTWDHMYRPTETGLPAFYHSSRSMSLCVWGWISFQRGWAQSTGGVTKHVAKGGWAVTGRGGIWIRESGRGRCIL